MKMRLSSNSKAPLPLWQLQTTEQFLAKNVLINSDIRSLLAQAVLKTAVFIFGQSFTPSLNISCEKDKKKTEKKTWTKCLFLQPCDLRGNYTKKNAPHCHFLMECRPNIM